MTDNASLADLQAQEELQFLSMKTNLSSDINTTCLWEDNVSLDSTCIDILAEEEKDYLYKVGRVCSFAPSNF